MMHSGAAMRRGLSRYAVVGLAATAAHYALLTALVEWAQWSAWLASGLHYLLAQAVATGVGLLVTYAINRVWTFAKPAPASPPPHPGRH